MANTTLVRRAVEPMFLPDTPAEKKERVYAQTERLIHEVIVLLDKVLVVHLDLPVRPVEQEGPAHTAYTEILKAEVSSKIYDGLADIEKNGAIDETLMRLIAFSMVINMLMSLPSEIHKAALTVLISNTLKK